MPLTTRDPPVNQLIAALPREDRQSLLQDGEQVHLNFADVLCEPGTPTLQVHFPSDSIISLIIPVAGHSGLEVGLVGIEGLLGIPVMLGVDIWPLRAVVQGAGPAWCMPASAFRQALFRSVALRQRLNRYVYSSMLQLALSAACARFHVVEARLARWLLMTQDRTRSDVFHVTQEFLANMLGVRRVGVTEAAGLLQRRRLIAYRRGHITVLDRDGLEAASCGCYRDDREVYERVLG